MVSKPKITLVTEPLTDATELLVAIMAEDESTLRIVHIPNYLSDKNVDAITSAVRAILQARAQSTLL